MSRTGLSTQLYVEVQGLNQAPGGGIYLGLQGTVAPGGDLGDQDASGIGSLYHRTDTGAIFRKKANAGSTSDWEELGTANLSNLVWRQEKVRFATDDTLAVGNVDITTLTDNEGMVIGDITIGEYALGDCDGTPALFEITAKPGGNDITLAAASSAIADNNTFVVQQFLPDSPAAQEAAAIIHFPTASSPCVKLSDFNWSLADGISLNGYSDTTGAISGTETVQVAIQKIEKGLKDLISVMGVSRNDTNLGAFASPATVFFTSTLSVKQALQTIGDLLAQLRGVQATGVTAEADVDVLQHANVKAVKWYAEAFEAATPANRRGAEIFAITDGTNVKDNIVELKLGSGNIVTWVVDVNGADFRLRASSSTAGITVNARRIEVVKNVL